MTHNRLPTAAAAVAAPDVDSNADTDAGVRPAARFDHTNPEDRCLYRLATQITQHDPELTQLLVHIARLKAQQRAVQEAG